MNLLRFFGPLFRIGCAAFLVSASAGFAAPTLTEPRHYRVAVEAEAYPFTFADENGNASGFAVELLRAVAAERGLEMDFMVLPWSEVLPKFRSGEIDIIANIVDTPERRDFIAFSSTTTTLHGAMFVRRTLPVVDNYEKINGLRVAVPRDSRAHEFLKRSGWQLDYVFVASLAESIAAVKDGTADAVFSTDLVAREIMRQQRQHDIVRAPLAFPELDYREHFGVSPANPLLLAELNEGLLAVDRHDLYDRLYERWIGPLNPRLLSWRELRPYTLPLFIVVVIVLVAFAWQRRMLLRLAAQAEALRQSEERLSLVLEGTQDGFWDWTPNNGTVYRSPRWYTMLGYTPGEIPATYAAFLELTHPEDRPVVMTQEQELMRDRDYRAIELRMRTKTGGWKWILDRGKVVSRDPQTKRPIRITGTHTDISARKQAQLESEQLQRRMQETQRLESLGVLAGGIAHDFNNLLTVILGNTSLMQLDKGTQTADRLGKIATAAKRAAELCRQLLAYAGKGALSLERIDVNAVVQDALRLFRPSAQPALKVETCLASSLPTIIADPLQLEQVVMNLLLNANDAVPPENGRITITTGLSEVRDEGLAGALTSDAVPGGTYVRLTIKDNGAGMTPEVRGRAFDPFFTTKTMGRGLGLPAALGIIRSLRGALTLETSPSHGSSFSIYLPVPQVFALESTASPVSFNSPPHHADSVLVVDNDAALHPLYMDLLGRLGYAVTICDSSIFNERAVSIDLQRFRLILLSSAADQQSPVNLVEVIRQKHREVTCALVGEQSVEEAAKNCDLRAFDAYLQKPLTLENLISALRLSQSKHSGN